MLSDILFYIFLAGAAILDEVVACRTQKHEQGFDCRNTSNIKPPFGVIRDDIGGMI